MIVPKCQYTTTQCFHEKGASDEAPQREVLSWSSGYAITSASVGKESEMGIDCSSELPFVFEMSQAFMVILVEHTRKMGDVISIKLFAFFLWKASVKWLWADIFTVGFCHWL